MADFTAHGEKLVNDYRADKLTVLQKRQKMSAKVFDDGCGRRERYHNGLACLSDALVSALGEYQAVFVKAVPEASCSLKIKCCFPDNLDVTFTLNHHSLRFISKPANAREQFQDAFIDGMLHCESAYKGGDRRLETQAALWGEIGSDAWGLKGHDGSFQLFINDLLPDLIESLWKRATFSLVHSLDQRDAVNPI